MCLLILFKVTCCCCKKLFDWRCIKCIKRCRHFTHKFIMFVLMPHPPVPLDLPPLSGLVPSSGRGGSRSRSNSRSRGRSSSRSSSRSSKSSQSRSRSSRSRSHSHSRSYSRSRSATHTHTGKKEILCCEHVVNMEMNTCIHKRGTSYFHC